MGRCQITSPTQRIPPGCRPEEVTLALGAPATSYAQPAQYTNNGYGSQVGAAQIGATQIGTRQAAQAGSAPQIRSKRPRLRGQFSMGIDHSVGGELYATEITPLVAA